MFVLVNPNLALGTHCSTSGDWIYSEKHEAFIWQGRELSTEEYNRIVEGIIVESAKMWPHRYIVPRGIAEDSDKLRAERDLWESRAREMRTVNETLELQLEQTHLQALIEISGLKERVEESERKLAHALSIAPPERRSPKANLALARKAKAEKKAAARAAKEAEAQAVTIET